MGRLASLFFGLSASAVLLLGCAADQPVEPSLPANGHDAALSTARTLAAPGNVVATGVSENEIDVSWFDNSSSETRFEVHRSTTGAGGTFALLTTTDANVVSYSDRSLELGTLICYKVRAVRVSRNKTTTYSEFSNTNCTIAPPAAPSNVKAVASSESRIDLSWQDNSSTEARFQILRSSDADNSAFAVLASTGANTVGYSDQSVVAGTRYCYLVQAVREYTSVDGDNTPPVYVYSAPSNTPCATPAPPPELPPAAYEVSAKPDNSSIVTVTVRWTDSSTTPAAFRIYRSTDGGAVWSLVSLASVVGADNGEFYDYPVASEQRVCYRVVAYNAAGDAPPSNPACTVPPAAPTNLVATVVDAQTIELRWSDNSAVEDGYEVWLSWFRGSYYCYGPGPGANDAGAVEGESLIALLAANTTTYRTTAYNNDGCNPPTTFWYYVVATRDGGRSDPSDAVSAASSPAP
jgi:hypothetical protein